eukprot:scaffold14141_cov22-Tisochrysis_lutea.AAC.1
MTPRQHAPLPQGPPMPLFEAALRLMEKQCLVTGPARNLEYVPLSAGTKTTKMLARKTRWLNARLPRQWPKSPLRQRTTWEHPDAQVDGISRHLPRTASYTTG